MQGRGNLTPLPIAVAASAINSLFWEFYNDSCDWPYTAVSNMTTW